MKTVDYLKKFDYPNIIELRFYNWDYMIAFAEYYHKEKLNQTKTISKMKKEIRQKLTHRQIQVLRLINKGYTSKDIALSLKISAQTVAVHRRDIMKRSGCHNVFQLVKFCNENNLK